MNKTFLFLLLLFSTSIYAQRGIVSGILADDTGPLPGANVIIKGTETGTQTDFDGNYTIECNVGDILVISYVGFTTREVTVTPEMLGGQITPAQVFVKKAKVPFIKNDAYAQAIKRPELGLPQIQSVASSEYTYNAKNQAYSLLYNIKNIEIKENTKEVTLAHSKPKPKVVGRYVGGTRLLFTPSSNQTTSNLGLLKNTFRSQHAMDIEFWEQAGRSNGGLDASFTTVKDRYHKNSNHQYSLGSNIKYAIRNFGILKASADYVSSSNRLANINGFQNQLLRLENTIPNSAATLDVLNDATSIQKQDKFTAATALSYEWNDHMTLKFIGRVQQSNLQQDYSIAAGDFGFTEDYSSLKKNKLFAGNATLDLSVDFDLSDNIGLTGSSIAKGSLNSLQYRFSETGNTMNLNVNRKPSKSVFEFANRVEIDYDNYLFLSLANTSLVSSIQESDSWIPQASISLIPTSLFYGLKGDFLNYLNLSARYGESAIDSPLLYNNYSHRSLTLRPEEAELYTQNQDLFINSDLKLEQTKGLEFALDARLWRNKIELGISYQKTKNSNGIFPVLKDGSFQLQNVVNSTAKNLDLELSLRNITGYNNRGILWSAQLALSRKRNKITSLLTAEDRIAIAGFNTVNTNLIVGQPASVLVDNSGNSEKIIGDSTPNFNFGITNSLTYKRWHFTATIDYQKGGFLWNGTAYAQNNFQGQATDYIEDASFLNIPTMMLSYEILDYWKARESGYKLFFNSATLSIYGNNLITNTQFRGANPYSGLFDGTSTQGLHFFNTPLTAEAGITLTVNF